MKLVTAIITTHNRKELLKRAIESVLNQTYEKIECIVIDDKSEDGTNIMCKQYPVEYIYIPPEESKGGNYARNKGIKAAKGDYIAFLDDDDYWLPNKIEKQVNLMEKMDCELVHCGKKIEIVKTEGISFVDSLPNPSHYGDMSRKILQTICTTTTTNIVAKKEALFDVGLFDENLKFWQEYELTIRMAQRKPFYFVNEPLSVYRVDIKDENRLTNKYFEWKEAVEYIHQKHQNLYDKLSFYERFKVKLLILNDAKKRAKASGLKYQYVHLLLITLPFHIISKLKHLIKK